MSDIKFPSGKFGGADFKNRGDGERIDPAPLLEVFGQRLESCGIGRAETGLHALAKRQRKLPSRTAIRSACDDRGSIQAA